MIEVPRGLKGVIVADTEIGDVRGQEGFYHYRQYSAVDVSAQLTLEDAWFLLLEGHLPDVSERTLFESEVVALRAIPEPVGKVLPTIAEAAAVADAGPLDALRSAVSLLATVEGLRPSLDISHEQLRADSLRICAAVPTLVAALHRLAAGLQPIDPRADLGHAANYLFMISGEVPDQRIARTIEQYMTSTIDHGFNASTFTARVVTSTGADLGSAVVAALGALSGPLHGGAPSRALDTLDAIGTPDMAETWVREAIARGERIMGFGHPVYRTYDPRSALLRQLARDLGGPLVDFSQQVEQTILALLEELKPAQVLQTNVEYYAGVVMELCGLPRSLSPPPSPSAARSDGPPTSSSRPGTAGSSGRAPAIPVLRRLSHFRPTLARARAPPPPWPEIRSRRRLHLAGPCDEAFHRSGAAHTQGARNAASTSRGICQAVSADERPMWSV